MTRGVCGGLSSKFAGFGIRGRRRRVRHRRAVRAVAAGALSAALLVGCSPAAPVPTTPPTTTAPPSPTPSPTDAAIVAPERPAEMERSDEVGAVAAAEYFMELFSYVMRSGDLEEWDRISAQDCGFCQRVRDDVARVYGSGGSFIGGQVKDVACNSLGQHPELGGYAIEVKFVINAGAEVAGNGTTAQAIPEEVGSAVADLVFSSDGWEFVELSNDPGRSVFLP